ncbi:MAG: hypothetical protein ACKOGI_07400 [Vulcanococcus sp.]
MTRPTPQSPFTPAAAERALFNRLQRTLLPHGQTLHRCPVSCPGYTELGDHYVTTGNVVIARHVDLCDWLGQQEAPTAGEVA